MLRLKFPVYQKDFLNDANKEGSAPFILVLERGEGEFERYETALYAKGHEKENLRYASKLVKTMLWAYGGYKFYLYGGESVIALKKVPEKLKYKKIR